MDSSFFKKQFGDNFRMSDDFKQQMNTDDIFEQLKGKMGNKGSSKSSGQGQEYEEISGENLKVEQTEYTMEEDKDMKFNVEEKTDLQDLSHLFKQEGNAIFMIT